MNVVNYMLIGYCILYLKTRSSESDVASMLAKGSYACLYLLSSFSAVIDSLEILSQLIALATRILEVFSFDKNSSSSPIPHVIFNNYSIPLFRPSKLESDRRNNIEMVDSNKYVKLDNSSNHGYEIASDITMLPITDKLTSNYNQNLPVDVIMLIRNIDVFSIDRKLLITSLSLQVSDGMRLLITGPSGLGKSTLVNLLAGIPGYFTNTANSRGAESSILFKVGREEVMYISQLSRIISVSDHDYSYSC